MFMKSLLVGAALALVSVPALAADPDCGSANLVKSSKLAIEACIDPATWDAGQGTGDQEFVYFSKDGKAGFAIVTEEPSVDIKAYHDAILQFATKQSGATKPVTSFDDQTSTINGKDWGSMHYNVMVQDQQLEFLNYYYSEDGLGSTQFIFWSLPADADTTRTDLADKETAEVAVLSAYLPERLSQAEIQARVAALVQELGASGPGDMGKVMGAAKQRLAAVADMGLVSAAVKAALAAK